MFRVGKVSLKRLFALLFIVCRVYGLNELGQGCSCIKSVYTHVCAKSLRCISYGFTLFVQMIPSISGQLSSLAAPVIFSFVVSLYVANVAMQIFGYAADTILQVRTISG